MTQENEFVKVTVLPYDTDKKCDCAIPRTAIAEVIFKDPESGYENVSILCAKGLEECLLDLHSYYLQHEIKKRKQ